MQKLLKIVAVSSLAIALAACSSTKNANQTQTSAAGDSDNAKAYALGQKGGLSGANGEGGGMSGVRHVNSLQAATNQVYYFAFDQSAVSASDMRAITVQANYLAMHKNAKVRLEGNADDVGSREYNIGLGWRRAQAVASVLKQQGVASSQIKMVSYGKEHPAVVGSSERARSLNRRVELIYVQK